VSLSHTIQQVTDRYNALPAAVHTESPRGVLSRVAANAFWTRTPSHERALTLAALAVVLLVAIDRSETLDITSGNEAA
jgi:hypothetical protein